uniref:Peptidase M14 domain-containing protein n=1 Tax=Sphenodon punctatus TaxID=8508 RepID=A0A8D0GQ97_SPHPU
GFLNFIKSLAHSMQLDFWHPDSAHHVVAEVDVDFQVKADQSRNVQSLLEQNQIHYEILFHNLQEEIEKQFDGARHFSSKHSYKKYNDWDKINAWTARMAKNHPKLVSRIQIGRTFEQRPMLLLKSGKKKIIFMDCGIHAREWISPAFCQWFVKQATKTYGKDEVMTKLLDNLNFYILPVYNIDGYVWAWTENRLWRKNRSNNSNTDCIGTDLNRNFKSFKTSPHSSEEETKVVATFIREHLSSIKAYLTIHAYSQMILFPYGYTFKQASSHDKLNKVAKGAVDSLTSLYGTKYTYGPAATTILEDWAFSRDWAYDEGIKYTYTFELRDKGKHGFLLPESLIKPTCKETMVAVKYIANHVCLKHTF